MAAHRAVGTRVIETFSITNDVAAHYHGMVMMNASGEDFRQVGLRHPTVTSWMPLPGGSKTKEKLDYGLTSTPALAGGFMYFRGSDCLWCCDLRQQ